MIRSWSPGPPGDGSRTVKDWGRVRVGLAPKHSLNLDNIVIFISTEEAASMHEDPSAAAREPALRCQVPRAPVRVPPIPQPAA